MGKSLNDIREMVNVAKDRDGYETDYRLDRLSESVDALIGYVECDGDYRTGPAALLPHGQEPSEGYLEDGRGGFVREAPAPGFMQPNGKRIGGATPTYTCITLAPGDGVAPPSTNLRNDMLQWTPAEKAIHDAVQAVESAGANPLLTDAVNLLAHARQKVAMWVENAPPELRGTRHHPSHVE